MFNIFKLVVFTVALAFAVPAQAGVEGQLEKCLRTQLQTALASPARAYTILTSRENPSAVESLVSRYGRYLDGSVEVVSVQPSGEGYVVAARMGTTNPFAAKFRGWVSSEGCRISTRSAFTWTAFTKVIGEELS